MKDANTIAEWLAQLPTLQRGEFETWFICAVAALGAVALALKLIVRKPPLEAEFVTKDEFRSFRLSVENDLSGLRERIDTRHVAVITSLEQAKAALLADSERRASGLHVRLSAVEAGLARVDERTGGR